jgi:hypothetical protein
MSTSIIDIKSLSENWVPARMNNHPKIILSQAHADHAFVIKELYFGLQI